MNKHRCSREAQVARPSSPNFWRASSEATNCLLSLAPGCWCRRLTLKCHISFWASKPLSPLIRSWRNLRLPFRILGQGPRVSLATRIPHQNTLFVRLPHLHLHQSFKRCLQKQLHSGEMSLSAPSKHQKLSKIAFVQIFRWHGIDRFVLPWVHTAFCAKVISLKTWSSKQW